MRSIGVHISASAALLLVASGAGVVPAAGQTATMRDSAGVVIVESQSPVWAGERRWTIDPVATLSVSPIGTPSRAGVLEVLGGVSLSDGRVAVAMSGPGVRFYSPEGAPVGEYGAPGVIRRQNQPLAAYHRTSASFGRFAGDSLYLYDNISRRLTVLHPTGVEARAPQIPLFPAQPRRMLGAPVFRGFGITLLATVRLLSDGRAVAASEAIPAVPDLGQDPRGVRGGVLRSELSLGYITPEDTAFAAFTTLAGDDVFWGINIEESGGDITGVHVTSQGASFARSGLWSVTPTGAGVVAGSNDRLSFRYLDAEGRTVRMARVPALDAPLDPTTVESMRVESLRRIDGDLDRRATVKAIDRHMWERAVAPDFAPRFHGIVVGAEGDVWLDPVADPESWPPGLREPTNDWLVFDPDGRWLGSVEVPPRARVLEVGTDSVLLLYRDQLDVEWVRRHRLDRSGG